MSDFIVLSSALVVALSQPVSLKATGLVWLSSREHARLQSLPGRVTLNPVKLGQFFVSGVDIDGRDLPDPTRVLVTTPANLRALRECPGERVIGPGVDGIVFTGTKISEVPVPCDFDRLELVASPPDDGLAREFVAAEARLRNESGIAGLAHWRGGRRVMRVASAADGDLARRALPAAFRAFYEFDARSATTPGRNLIFELTLFEFSRDKARNLGIKWPRSISLLSIDAGGALRPKLLERTAGDDRSEILLATDFGESQGVGKVLAQPTLRTQPGVESRFVSGGEIPIRSNNAFHSQTTWKAYGLRVALTPDAQTQTGDREVSVDFKMEFSEPNPDLGIDGVPGIIQRQLESRFDVRLGELTILTTMVTLREGKAREGLAFLSQVPLLGLLFGQQVRRRNDSELWFALRPTWDEITPGREREVTLDSGWSP